jgi:hypothetical protein
MPESSSDPIAPLGARFLQTRARVQPVCQVLVRLGQDEGGSTFHKAQKIVLDWIGYRAGQTLPPEAWRGEPFELDDVGAQRTAAVSIDNPRYWAARLDDSDRSVAKRSWVTEVGLAEAGSNEVAFGARLQCVTMGGEFSVQPSIPAFVRAVIEQVPLARLEGRLLTRDPWFVRTQDEIEDLAELIESRSRGLDVIVCSLPDGSEDPGEAIVDVSAMHRRTLGVAHIAVLSGPASYMLTERLGREFSVFRSAVRSYRPGFDASNDEPFRHPTTIAARIAGWAGGGPRAYEQFLIGGTIVRSASRRDAESALPPFTQVKRVAAQLRREAAQSEGSPPKDLLALADQEIRELREGIERDRATYDGLVQQYEEERDQALEDLQQIRALNGNLQQRLRALQFKVQREAPTGVEATVPENLDGFEEWCRDNLSGAIDVHNRAFKAVKKSRYEDIGLLYQSLLLLRDFYVPMKIEGGLEKKRQFEQRCAALGLAEEPTFSGERWGEQGDSYKVRYAGRSRLLDRHLKKGTSREERHCFRLYFFWDEETEQVVVGWLPSHLDTRAT